MYILFFLKYEHFQIPVEAITGNGTEEKKDDGDKVEAVVSNIFYAAFQ